jgi:hypothetical protein
MPILTIRHVTTYHYKRPVAFGEHRMMLRPRDDDDQKVLESALEITPNRDLVRVAVAHEPRKAIPLQGTWIGTASDHLAMKVAVKVAAQPDAGTGRGR